MFRISSDDAYLEIKLDITKKCLVFKPVFHRFRFTKESKLLAQILFQWLFVRLEIIVYK